MALQIFRSFFLSKPKPSRILSVSFTTKLQNPSKEPDDPWTFEYPEEPTNRFINNNNVKGFPKPKPPDLPERLTQVFTKPSIKRGENELRILQGGVSGLTTVHVEKVLSKLGNWMQAFEFFKWSSLQKSYKHNCYTYNAMASILAKNKQTEPMKELLYQLSNEKCAMTTGAFGFLVRTLGSLCIVDKVVEFFDNAENFNCTPNTYTYNCLIEVLAKANRLDLVDVKYKEMLGRGHSPDKFTYTALLRAYCMSEGKSAEAMEVLKTMSKHGYADSPALSTVAVGLSKAGQVDKAIEMVDVMRKSGVEPNEKTYHVLIHGFVKGGHVSKAVGLMKLMKESRVPIGISAYAVVIDGFCDRGEYMDAYDLYVEIRDQCGSLGSNVLGKLIRSLAAHGHLDKARELLKDRLSSPNNSILGLYNSVLEELVRVDNAEGAYSLLWDDKLDVDSADDKIAGDVCKKPIECYNAMSFFIVVDGLCKSGKFDIALGLLQDIEKLGISFGLEEYSTLISHLCREDRPVESYKLMLIMNNKGMLASPETINLVLDCLFKAGKVTETLEIIQEMAVRGQTTCVEDCSLFAKRLCEQGKVEDAVDFLDGMKQIGYPTDLISSSTVICGLCNDDKVDDAFMLFKEICSKSLDLEAYSALINAFCKYGRMQEVQEILNHMLAKGVIPSLVTYNKVIYFMCKVGHVDSALSVVLQMNENGTSPNVYTYSTLIHGLFDAEITDAALDLWNEMKQKGLRPDMASYTALIQGLCKSGMSKLAFEYFQEMETHGLRPGPIIYSTLENGLTLAGELDLASQVKDKAGHMKSSPSASDN